MPTKKPTKKQIIQDILNVQNEFINSGQIVTRNQYREHGNYSENDYVGIFGTFQELKRQAGLIFNRIDNKIIRSIAKHASSDNLKTINKERKNWGDRYLRKNSSRYQLLIGAADIHDMEVDPFWLRVFLDTLKRTQPDIITFAGDIFDFPEFSKFYIDPRDWDLVGHIRFAHEKILGPVRECVPDAQIDLIEGNHEGRTLKHLSLNSMSLKVFLSDWVGLTVEKALRLDEHRINYIAQADLGAWTQADINKELAKNFKIYFDCLLVHHETNIGRSYGYPGFSGHNHKHLVYSDYSPMFGAFEWHQIGCGCRRNAVYTDGLKWHNGFILCHIDTKDKKTNFEYVPITDHACVGGKYYYRDKSEIVIVGHK